MASKDKDKKSPEQQANESALNKLKSNHRKEYDDLLSGEKEKQRQQPK